MVSFGSKTQRAISILSFCLISGCATIPYPYFDSAFNDHNRAPSSVALPADETMLTTQADKVNQQAKLDYLFLSAEMSALEGQNADAIAKLEEAYELDSQSTVILYKLAMENYRAGKNEAATKWIDKALTLKPMQKDLNILAASLYSSAKQYQKSEAIYKKLIALDKADPDAYLYLAAIYSEQKKYREAIQFFTKLTKFPDYEQKHLAYYYGARTKFEADRVKHFNEIKSDLRLSLKEKPEYLEALQFLGQLIEKTEGKKKVFAFYAEHQKKYGPIGRLAEVLSQYYLEIGDYDNAYVQLEIVESSTQDPIQVKLKMALILIDKKMYDKALVRLEELNQLVPESDKVKFYLASLYQETKRNDQAIKTYLGIQASSKHYEDAVKNAATLNKEAGQQDKALDLLKQLVKDKSDNVMNFVAYAQLLEENKQYDTALSVLNLAHTKFPQEAQIEYFIGTIYDKKNDKKAMLEHMHKAVELDPKMAVALNYIAYSLMEMNQDMAKAEEFAMKAYSLDKNDPYIVDTVGWIYYQKADYVKAAEYLEKAHQSMPEVSVIADHLGDAYVKLNQFDKAYDVYKKAISNETDPDRLKQMSYKLSETKVNQDNGRMPAGITVKKMNPESVYVSDKDESK
jgi:tetratricopeptide (TPR) repeat protein